MLAGIPAVILQRGVSHYRAALFARSVRPLRLAGRRDGGTWRRGRLFGSDRGAVPGADPGPAGLVVAACPGPVAVACPRPAAARDGDRRVLHVPDLDLQAGAAPQAPWPAAAGVPYPRLQHGAAPRPAARPRHGLGAAAGDRLRGRDRLLQRGGPGPSGAAPAGREAVRHPQHHRRRPDAGTARCRAAAPGAGAASAGGRPDDPRQAHARAGGRVPRGAGGLPHRPADPGRRRPGHAVRARGRGRTGRPQRPPAGTGLRGGRPRTFVHGGGPVRDRRCRRARGQPCPGLRPAGRGLPAHGPGPVPPSRDLLRRRGRHRLAGRAVRRPRPGRAHHGSPAGASQPARRPGRGDRPPMSTPT